MGREAEGLPSHPSMEEQGRCQMDRVRTAQVVQTQHPPQFRCQLWPDGNLVEELPGAFHVGQGLAVLACV